MSGKINKINRLGDGHYLTSYVDVCRNCKGTGTISGSKCAVCQGTGRVVVSKEIHIKVEPYKTT